VESAGYIIKGHKHGNKEDYSITIDSDENTILIFKYAR
jgi:hypothetical protein